MMEYEAYLRTIDVEADALAEAAEESLDAVVPSCPGWDLAELVRHTGQVHRWAAKIVGDSLTERFRIADIPVPADAAGLPGWVRAGASHLTETLASAGPDRNVWTFGSDRTSTFWARRQAHETAVHRWDAQGALGTPTALRTEMSADGVDEFLTVHLARYAGRATEHWSDATWNDSGPTFHLHCTDTEGEWLVRLTDGMPMVTREHALGTVAARGRAEGLLLAAWGRTTFADGAELFGDAADVAAWQARWRRLFD